MKAIKLIAVVSMFAALSACNTKQDPLADASDAIKNGVPPSTKPVQNEEPLSKVALQIDSPLLVNGRVGSLTEIKIQGRVLIPGVGFKLQIENMAQFPGATFDPVTGLFRWTPSKEALPNGLDGQFELNIALVTVPGNTGYPVSVEKKTITLNIFRNYTKPMITSVVGNSSNMIVGGRYDFAVMLEDFDSSLPSDFSLFFKDCSNGTVGRISQAVSYQNINFIKDTQPGKFRGFVTMNLTDTRLAFNNRNFCFTVTAVSKYYVSSNPYQVDVVVKNPLQAAKTTRSIIDVKKGTSGEYNISFFDPGQVGAIKVSKMPDLTALPGSTITCDNNFGYTAIVDCKLVIDATSPTVLPGKVDLTFTTQNTLYPQDTVESNLVISVNVKEIL
ncbi:MAG: hypothetical protein H7328_07835 [Bdellovibrio sp.]|nr:hypothetical protein [Bdellovibrio sp.]